MPKALFKCPHEGCPSEGYAQKVGLTRHLSSAHSGGDPRVHRCPRPNCNRAYTRFQLLKAHVRSVHDGVRIHQCPRAHCNSAHSRADYLRAHIRTVHDGVRLKCLYCEDTFQHRQAIVPHMKRKHSDKEATTVGVQSIPPPDGWVDKTTLSWDDSTVSTGRQDVPETEPRSPSAQSNGRQKVYKCLYCTGTTSSHSSTCNLATNRWIQAAEAQSQLSAPQQREQQTINAQPPIFGPTSVNNFDYPSLPVEEPSITGEFCWECLFLPHGEYCFLHTFLY